MSDFENGSSATFPAAAAPGRMAVGDLDGDGDADILYQTAANGSAFQYARSNGDGTFTILAQAASPFAGLTLPDNAGGSYYIEDFDGDGDLDIFAAVANATGSYFRNNGSTFTWLSASTAPVAATATRMVAGDFDGDGYADILFQTAGNGTAFQFARSNGDGTFTIVAQSASPFAGLTLPDHIGTNYTAGDFDGDGDIDLQVAVASATGSYFVNAGGSFTSVSTTGFPAGPAAGRQIAGDFDADGDLDILYQTAGNGTAFEYARNNGNSTFTILSLAASPFAGLALPDHTGSNYFAADFDGDGDTDLLAGAANATGSYFYQVGKPPELASSTPADNATNVAVATNITLTFDESVTKGSGNIYIVRSDDIVIETISVNSAQVTGSGTTWTIDPSVTLSGLTGYSILLDAGTFRDADGAIFAGIDDMATLNFTTVVVNTPPTQAANAGLTLNEGATGTITAARLDFNDAQQADTAITFTITTLATNGLLRLNGSALGLNGTFTQDDINNNRVTYVHNGSETTSASFGFSVSDGAGGSVTGRTFAFTITPVNDVPVHSLPASIATVEDEPVGLNGGVAIDPAPTWIDDADSNTITTTLSAVDGSFTAVAFGGALVTDAGTNAMSVTGSAADVNKTVYYASYTPALDVNGSRTITVTTSDGIASTSDTITVSISAARDAPEGADVTRTAIEDTAYVLQASDFGFSDSDGNALAAIRVSSVPLHGRIIDAGGYLIPGDDVTGDGQPDLFEIAPERTFAAGDLIALDLLALGYIRYVPAANASGTAADSFTYQVVDDGAAPGGSNTVDPTPNTFTFDITAVDDPAVAVNDSGATVAENAATTFDVRGNDSDIDGPALAVAQVNGTAATVGVAIGLASGATVTLEADGRLTYDPNGKFNYLISPATVGDSAAVNISATDNFSYKLAGGGSATVTVTVTGVTSAGDQLWGDASDNTITGTSGVDVFNLSQGGEDTATGGTSNDGFYMGAALSAGDSLNGEGGSDDQIALQGNYGSFLPLPGTPFVLAATHLVNIETLVFLPGNDARFGDTSGSLYSYHVATIDDNVGAGQKLTVNFNSLRSGENVIFDGSLESDGWFLTFGGLGNDTITGGDQNDGFYFGNLGRWGAGDSVDGGAGDDQLGLQGNYTVTFTAGQLTGIETIALLTGGDTRFGAPPGFGYSYDLTMDDGNVVGGTTMIVNANSLRANVPGINDETLTFDGSAETDGQFTIYSGAGADVLTGGDQDDTIFGAGGADTMTGGAGNDTFAYMSAAHSTATAMDQILDFSLGDRINLTNIDAIAGGGNDAFSFIGADAFHNVAGELRVVDLGGGSWRVEADIDGIGGADLVIGVTTDHALTAIDFMV